MTGLFVAEIAGPAPGPRYVCLHGWMGSHRTFAKLAKQLPGAFLAVDLPGYGDSAQPARWGAQEVLQPLERMFEERDLRDVVLVGNCGGASLAVLLAHRVQDRLRGVVLIEPFGWLPWYFGLFTWPLLGPFFFWCSFRNRIGRAVVRRATRTPENAFGMDTLTASTAAGFLRMLGREQTTPQMFDLPCAVSIVRGERTFSAVTLCAEDWATRFRDCQMTVMSDGDHLLLQSHASSLAELLEAKLDDVEHKLTPTPSMSERTSNRCTA